MRARIVLDASVQVMRGVLVATLALGGAAPALAKNPNQEIDQQASYEVEVHRTEGGIPHVYGHDFASIGYGTGYAMAEDLICTLAEQFLTFGAERALYLGPTGTNIASDFFFQLLIDRGEAEEPVDPRQAALFRGAAAGYNRYLREVGVENLSDPRCVGAAWVREIGEIDFRRISRTNFFLPFVSGLIVAASPPASVTVALPEEIAEPVVADAGPVVIDPALIAGLVPEHKGSNGIGLGGDATQNGRGMLLANPHQGWVETERFYAFHQNLPGEYNVIGANIIGRPQVGVGTNEDVAWTSTVSTASRFSFYQMILLPGSPTTYLFDDIPMPMIQETVTIQLPDGQGGSFPLSHTFYSTHFGAFMVGAIFPWNDFVGFAVRPAEAGWRGTDSLVAQFQATTVEELKAVHDAGQYLPVNLVAADSSGSALYADPGPVPNITDAQRSFCEPFGTLLGNISACQWGNDPDAAAPGLFGPSNLPSLIRSDYVSNSNDSYWLANPNQPLTGFNSTIGTTGGEQTLRTRSANKVIEERLAGTDGLGAPGFSLENLQTVALGNRNESGELLRDGLVGLCNANGSVMLPGGGNVDVSGACPVLASWDLRDNRDSEGTHVFREFMRGGNGGRRLPSSWNYLTPFDAANPISTPSGLDPTNNAEALVALGESVQAMNDAGIALDEALGNIQGVTRQGEYIPLGGGPESGGVLNKIEAAFAGSDGYPEVTASSSSWIQVTSFTEDGPVSKGILTYSQSTNPASPHFADLTKKYSDKEWVDLPYYQDDVESAALSSLTLKEGKNDCKKGGWQDYTNPAFADQSECVEYFDLLRMQRLDEIKARE
jgi:acyl-homoserine-lactone acylase